MKYEYDADDKPLSTFKESSSWAAKLVTDTITMCSAILNIWSSIFKGLSRVLENCESTLGIGEIKELRGKKIHSEG